MENTPSDLISSSPEENGLHYMGRSGGEADEERQLNGLQRMNHQPCKLTYRIQG